jgi:hypothetical protein
MHLIYQGSPPKNGYSQAQVTDLSKGALTAIKSAPEAAQGILLIVAASPQQPEHQSYSHPKKPKDRGRDSRLSRGQANGSFNVLMEKKSSKENAFSIISNSYTGPPELSTNTSGEQQEFRVDNCQQQKETSKDPINPPGEPENPSVHASSRKSTKHEYKSIQSLKKMLQPTPRLPS